MMPEYLSASRITQYLMCPLKYRLQYEDKAEWDFTPSNLILGSVIHSAIEGYYLAWQAGEKMPLGELVSLYEKHWDSASEGKVFEPGCNATLVKETGRGLLKAFAESVSPGVILGIEDRFRVPLIDPETGEYLIDLVGVFDLIEADQEGVPVVVDHKTACKRYSDADLENNLQLTAYGYASRQLYQLEGAVLLRIDAMVKNKTAVFDQKFTLRTVDTDRRFVKLAKDILHALSCDAFPPNPGWVCARCNVGSSCYLGG